MPFRWNPFNGLNAQRRTLLDRYGQLLLDYNRRLNLISKGSETDIARSHILHSLFLAYRLFPDGSTVVDWGTGGGLPGIPLAIRFPEVSFVLVESRIKKAVVVQSMVRDLGLANVDVWHGRAEEWNGSAEYSISRATASLVTLWSWNERIATAGLERTGENVWPNGLLCLKGGAIDAEVGALKKYDPSADVSLFPISDMTMDAHFADKHIVLVRRLDPPA